MRPKLDLACGISGALQHRQGMDGSGAVIAINTDPSAPIFELCDLGVVGDLHEVVPRVIDLVRAWKASPRERATQPRGDERSGERCQAGSS